MQACYNGCNRNIIDSRGRWKHRICQLDIYVDTTVPYPSGKVCADLCVDGTVRYDLMIWSGLDDSCVLKNVIPYISKYHFHKKATVVFGEAILWACFDPLASHHVPQGIMSRVPSQYEYIQTLDAPTKPAKKISLIICGHEG